MTEKSLAYFQGSDQLQSFAADTDLLGENALAVIASCPNLQIVSVTGDRVVFAQADPLIVEQLIQLSG